MRMDNVAKARFWKVISVISYKVLHAIDGVHFLFDLLLQKFVLVDVVKDLN